MFVCSPFATDVIIVVACTHVRMMATELFFILLNNNYMNYSGCITQFAAVRTANLIY